jgi:hypothetical protein
LTGISVGLTMSNRNVGGTIMGGLIIFMSKERKAKKEKENERKKQVCNSRKYHPFCQNVI